MLDPARHFVCPRKPNGNTPRGQGPLPCGGLAMPGKSAGPGPIHGDYTIWQAEHGSSPAMRCDSMPIGPETDPTSPYRPQPGGRVMLRGGDDGQYHSLVEWPTHPWYTRSAYRMSASADFTMGSFGFRMVLEGNSPTAVERTSWGEIKSER